MVEGEEVQEEVVLRQQGVVLEKAECQEDLHLLPLLDRFHDQKGTCLLSYRNPFLKNQKQKELLLVFKSCSSIQSRYETFYV